MSPRASGPDTLFGPAAGRFLGRLARNNNRDWFVAHRSEYDELIAEPMQFVLDSAVPVYGAGRVMRPHRDVRFSKDKSPYKTSASLWAGNLAGVYLSLDQHGLSVGGGLYGPSPHQLRQARALIDDQPRAARQLAAVVDRL